MEGRFNGRFFALQVWGRCLRRKAKGKKRAGEKDRYRFVRDVQILASMNAPKKLLN